LARRPAPWKDFGMAPVRPLLAALVAATAGCASVRPLPAPTPELPMAAWENGELGAAPAPAGGERRGPTGSALAKSGPKAFEAPAPPVALAPPPTAAPSPIPGRAACLSALHERGVRFRASEPVLGIVTPVVLEGSIDGIRFHAADHREFVADCRLVLALREIAPDLRALGVSEVRFSGAYVYKLTNPRRMSMHAYGLAVDLHAFTIGGSPLEVKEAFARGAHCGGSLPALNQIACRIRARGLFKEQLGPDDNAAHFDHLHLGLKPLPDEVPTDLPLPAALKPAKRPPRLSERARSASRRSVR
jgi:hypothetical protein